MDWISFFSGIGGVFIGSIITVILYWHSNYKSAKRRFVDKLIILKNDVWWNCKRDTTQSYKIWDGSLQDILLLYNAVHDWTFLCKRIRLEKAWKRYKGEVKGAKDETLTKSPPKDKDDFIHRIDNLLNLL